MRRVAITGIGIVSSIGNNVAEVTQSLREGRSGIVHAPEYAELGFRSQIHGTVKMDIAEHIDRKQLRFMGDGAAYAVLAMEQAIADSGLDEDQVSNPRTGLIAGSGGAGQRLQRAAPRLFGLPHRAPHGHASSPGPEYRLHSSGAA